MNAHPHNPRRGSVLLVALLLGMAMAIAATSYLSLSLNTLKISDHTYHYNTAFNLAEAGLEEALWALNNGGDDGDWTKRAWTDTGDDDKVLLGSFGSSELTAANSVAGYYHVYVQNAHNMGGTPIITAEGVVRPTTGPVVRKQIRIFARKSNLFMPPFTAITSLTLNGGEIDSYRMAEGDYSTAPRRYETTVASPTVTIGDISIGSPADIYGYVTVGVGTTNSSAFISGIKGTVQGDTTVAGADGVLGSGTGDFVDTNRIAFDFTQDFPMPAAPTGAFTDTIPAADPNGFVVLGDPTGTTTKRYQVANWSVPNGTTVLVVGPVELKVLGELSLAGKAAFTVLTGTFSATPKNGSPINYTATQASASLYAYGNLQISGNGALTGGTIPGANISTDPTKLKIYGLASTSQDFVIGGNGKLAAAVYAPKADVTFNGGGSSGCFAGATVANTITVNGNGYAVRFPEEMANMNTSTTYQISRWAELIDHSAWHDFAAN